jgi:hypothetical protein
VKDGQLFAIDARLDVAIDRVDEVVAVQARVKADDAAAEQPLQDLVAPGADAEALRVGPGDVPEREDCRARQAPPHQLWHQRKVVVLHEHDRILGVRLVADSVGELLIDLLVVRPVIGAEHRPCVRVVAQRPQPLVRKSEVVAALLLAREPDPAQRIGFLARRHAQPAVRVGGLAIGGAAAVRDPDARAGTHHRLQRRHQAARGEAHRDLFLRMIVTPMVPVRRARHVLVDVRLAVGDDDDLLADQLAA